jgi:adenylosuccinate synthase
MKTKKVFTVTDLGGGDGGKGGVVHKICSQMNAHTVLKVGGAQGSHGVRTASGESFNFSQFGCGTFERVKTHITDRMVVEPFGILAEADSLRYEHQVRHVFDLLTVDENCLCAIPYHGIASRLRELSRKENQKGTVGVGVGEAMLDSERYPDLAIRVKDLGKPDIRDRIEAVRRHKCSELISITENIDDLWEVDQELARKEIALLCDPAFVDWMMGKFARFSKEVTVVDFGYLPDKILSQDGTVVVESSHGILTDKYHGFHPFTSRLRTVPTSTFDLLKMCGYDGDIVKLGVTRAYQIRHGAGPMVTEDCNLTSKLLPGSSKNQNRWQGQVRVGPLDFVALRYSIGVCGGPEAFDGIAVTWFDQIQAIGEWKTCNEYFFANDLDLFTPSGEISIRRGEDDAQIAHQGRLAQALFRCQPVVVSKELVPGTDREYLAGLCSRKIQSALGVPVRMISFGPTENDKMCL